MNKFYLAASWSRRAELQEYSLFLEDLGYEVTSRWLRQGLHDTGVGLENALMDEEDVRRCDVLVAFSDKEPRGRGGRHVEFGMARALGKKLVLVGPREHVFHHLPGILEYPGWDSFKECLGLLRT